MTNHPDAAGATTPNDVTNVTIPDFPRKFTRLQPKGPREFNVNGPKADAVIRHLLAGGFTTDEIVTATGASASRVSECRWGLEAAGIAYPPVARKSTAKAAAAALPVVTGSIDFTLA
jgi:hypothetical protein